MVFRFLCSMSNICTGIFAVGRLPMNCCVKAVDNSWNSVMVPEGNELYHAVAGPVRVTSKHLHMVASSAPCIIMLRLYFVRWACGSVRPSYISSRGTLKSPGMAASATARVKGESSSQKVPESLAQTGFLAICFSTLSSRASILSISTVALWPSLGNGDRRRLFGRRVRH